MIRGTTLLLCIYLLCLNQVAYAHPGRTDDSGGHTCRTDCGSWGLEYGEYHTHDYESDYSPSTTVPAQTQDSYSTCYTEGYNEWKLKVKNPIELYSYYENNFALAFEEVKDRRFPNQGCADGYSSGMTTAISEPIQRASDSYDKQSSTFGYRDGKNDYYKKLPYAPNGDDRGEAYSESYIKGWNEAKTNEENEKVIMANNKEEEKFTQTVSEKEASMSVINEKKEGSAPLFNQISLFVLGVIVTLLILLIYNMIKKQLNTEK
jgi:hypothetical protein